MSATHERLAAVFELAETPEGRARLAEREPGPGEVALPGDGYILPRDDADDLYHRLISEALEERLATLRTRWTPKTALKETEAWAAITKLKRPEIVEVLNRAILRTTAIGAAMASIEEQVRPRQEVFNDERWAGRVKPERELSELVRSLLLRKLPVSAEDLVLWCRWLATPSRFANAQYYGKPITGVIKAVENYAKDQPVEGTLRASLTGLIDRLTTSHSTDLRKYAARIVKAIGGGDLSPGDVPIPPHTVPWPAEIGMPRILTSIKQKLGIPCEVSDAETETLDPDGYPMPADSPLRDAHAHVGAWLQHLVESEERYNPSMDSDAAQTILGLPSDELAKVVLASCERAGWSAYAPSVDWEAERDRYQARESVGQMSRQLRDKAVVADRSAQFHVWLYESGLAHAGATRNAWKIKELAEAFGADGGLTEGERHVIYRTLCCRIAEPPMGRLSDSARALCESIGLADGFWLVPGEHWADAVHADAAAMSGAQRSAWFALLTYAATATASKPSVKWAKGALPLCEAIGTEALRASLCRWFGEVARGRSVRMLRASTWDTQGDADTLNEGNATILRGLVWIAARQADPQTPHAVADLLATAIKKVPGVGPRAVKVANACVWALGEMAAHDDPTIRDRALGQLARLKARVTFKTTLKAIEKALDKAAEQSGIPREDLEELAVPAFDFDAGVRRETLGDAEVELRVERNRVVTAWTNAKGKAVKSPPASVKRDFKEELKDIKLAAKDAEGILLAGRDRIDTLFLAQRDWSVADWRERYLDHGLIGTIARRLIWVVDETPVLFNDGQARDIAGNPVEHRPDARVRLWHPVGAAQGEIVDWRSCLENLQITQPFKQAHREVYLLTDAERNTASYSNRYASHIIKQHQFNALCAARGWHNQLRLMVDDSYPPAHRVLPGWGLRAEFWVEGVGEGYGTDTNDAGTYHYLATDQVRFYRDSAAENWAHAGGGGYTTNAAGPGDDDINAPVPLDEVPPLVLSEVMRDVDLFVGVASVGNDPNWQDGGPEGRYREYWSDYAFGELAVTAKTRREILQRLIPRLKIADRCTFEDRYLVVRGDVRTYKIHIGSANILMEPNDQYLCIVQGRGGAKLGDKVYLPFEGDARLALILSKAMMLAEDTKIKDKTILSQIYPT